MEKSTHDGKKTPSSSLVKSNSKSPVNINSTFDKNEQVEKSNDGKKTPNSSLVESNSKKQNDSQNALNPSFLDNSNDSANQLNTSSLDHSNYTINELSSSFIYSVLNNSTNRHSNILPNMNDSTAQGWQMRINELIHDKYRRN